MELLSRRVLSISTPHTIPASKPSPTDNSMERRKRHVISHGLIYPLLNPSTMAHDTTMQITAEIADSSERMVRTLSLTFICLTKGMTTAAAVPPAASRRITTVILRGTTRRMQEEAPSGRTSSTR